MREVSERERERVEMMNVVLSELGQDEGEVVERTERDRMDGAVTGTEWGGR